MLPLEAQRRLINAIPSEIPIMVDGERRTYPIDIWWAHEDREMDYPSIELEILNAGVRNTAAQPFDGHVETIDSDDPAIAYSHKYVERVYDDIIVRVATQGVSGGVSAAERSRLFTDRLSRFFRFEVDLNNFGLSGNADPIPDEEEEAQPPMLIRVIESATDTSSLLNQSQVSRWEFSIRVFYVLSHVEHIDAVDAARIDRFEDREQPLVASFRDGAVSSMASDSDSELDSDGNSD